MAMQVLLALLPMLASAEKWAVIAAGSQGFWNYRHQADACHAYQLMLKSGVPADNIILMMQDDVAQASENPFPGQLFNRPGDDSPDVYKGCKVDYRGKVVTAQLFMDVLTGNSEGATGKVLKSKADDTVFVNFVDHGGPGIVAFPNGPFLHVKDLSKTLKTMQSKHMFKQMVFYMEACESGSMFPDLEEDGKILAVTASNAQESSWGTYCGDAAKVRGKNIGSCLGDLFSVNWMQDDDLGKFASETFSSQIAKVIKLTNKSHVCSFGDKSFLNEAIGNVEASRQLEQPAGDALNGAVDTRDIYVTQAFWAYENADTSEERANALKRFAGVVQDREADEAFFEDLAKEACSDVNLFNCQQNLRADRAQMNDMDCHYKLAHVVHERCPVSEYHHATGGWNGFNMKFSQVLLNLCESQGPLGKSTADLVQLVERKCTEAAQSRANMQLVI